LSSPADTSLHSFAGNPIEHEPNHCTEGHEESDGKHFKEPQHQAGSDQEADPGCKVGTVQDEYPDLFGLCHALGLGECGAV
jgi:hypothetical protein